jgi:hypothetical protein
MSIISRLVIPPGNKSMVGTCVNVVVVVYVVFDESLCFDELYIKMFRGLLALPGLT